MCLRCDEGGNCLQLVAQGVLTCVSETADSTAAWRVEGMFAQFDGCLYPKWKNADTGGGWGGMRVPIVFSWLLNVFRNGAMESQILVLFWCVDGMHEQFDEHLHPKRKNMDPRGDSGAIQVAIVFIWLPKV